MMVESDAQQFNTACVFLHLLGSGGAQTIVISGDRNPAFAQPIRPLAGYFLCKRSVTIARQMAMMKLPSREEPCHEILNLTLFWGCNTDGVRKRR
jgi:hypothetical protein